MKQLFNIRHYYGRPFALLFCIVVAYIGFLQATPGFREETGIVVSVLDGDTYDLKTSDNQRLRIRMEGIDAPERGMPYYKASRDYLSQMCAGKKVRARWLKKDRNGRLLAWTYLPDGRELSRDMLRTGWAWHFTKYNSDPSLAALQTAARQRRTGLWADPRPVAPWDYRKMKRAPRK